MSYEQEHENIKAAQGNVWNATEELRAALKSIPLFDTTVGEYRSIKAALHNLNSLVLLLERDMGVNQWSSVK